MFRIFLNYVLSVAIACFGAMTSFAMVQAAEMAVDPMQPPAYALKQFKRAKLKKPAKPSQRNNIAVKKVPQKPLRLNTILIGQARKVAIINDRMVVKGDSIDNARVVRILKDRVELIRKGKRISLKLDNNIISVRKNSTKSNL